MNLDEHHIAFPRLYGAPAYARPPRTHASVDRPEDPDDLPLEAFRGWGETGGDGYGTATDAGAGEHADSSMGAAVAGEPIEADAPAAAHASGIRVLGRFLAGR